MALNLTASETALATGALGAGATYLASWVVPKWIKRKFKVEADSQIVTSALKLAEALDKHAGALSQQLAFHEAQFAEREARYEEKIDHLEATLAKEKSRCDGLERQVQDLSRQLDDLRRKVESAERSNNGDGHNTRTDAIQQSLPLSGTLDY